MVKQQMINKEQFLNDVLRGLGTSPKYLESKYFYDETGDALFREIMACPEYYLTRCEMEIYATQGKAMADTITNTLHDFDIVELGPGDASKSVYLLRALAEKNIAYTYYPIDISANVIAGLSAKLPGQLPGIKMEGLNGDYFDMLEKLKTGGRPKVVLFLGSSIGNVPLQYIKGFLDELRSHLSKGDLALIGFDLAKDPATILAAYNDKGGITRRFNLNLLSRINTILDANFDVTQFEHRPEYDAAVGAAKSYLVSLCDQQVRIGGHMVIPFEKGERVFMEIAQKYTAAQTDEFARQSDFLPIGHYFDSKRWFMDALWQAV